MRLQCSLLTRQPPPPLPLNDRGHDYANDRDEPLPRNDRGHDYAVDRDQPLPRNDRGHDYANDLDKPLPRNDRAHDYANDRDEPLPPDDRKSTIYAGDRWSPPPEMEFLDISLHSQSLLHGGFQRKPYSSLVLKILTK